MEPPAVLETEKEVVQTNTTTPTPKATSPPTAQMDHIAKPTWTKKTERIWLAAAFSAMILAGWNDSQTGPLLLRIQANYQLTYTIVSLIFVFAFVGFFAAALTNVYLTDRLGFGKVISIGAACQLVAYAIQSPAPPFPLYCISFVISGMGMGLQDAQSNTLVAGLDLRGGGVSWRMSLLHAFYGLGALICPLIATQFAQIEHWNYHYLTSMAVAFLVLSGMLIVFRLRSEEELLSTGSEKSLKSEEEVGVDSVEITTVDGKKDDGLESPVPSTPTHTSGSKMREILLSPAVQLLALFCLIYVGIEITIGGWIVTFLVTERGAGPSAGYVSSGFFGGLMVGRVGLLWVNRKVGERRAIIMYLVIAMALEFVVWFVPSIVGNAVAVSFVGMALGPVYALIMNQTTHILPTHLYGGAIGYIASLGQAGSAIFPFITGALSQKYGVWVLQPLIVGMLGLAVMVWLVVFWMTRGIVRVL